MHRRRTQSPSPSRFTPVSLEEEEEVYFNESAAVPVVDAKLTEAVDNHCDTFVQQICQATGLELVSRQASLDGLTNQFSFQDKSNKMTFEKLNMATLRLLGERVEIEHFNEDGTSLFFVKVPSRDLIRIRPHWYRVFRDSEFLPSLLYLAATVFIVPCTMWLV